MITALLLLAGSLKITKGKFKSASESLLYYSSKRTKNNKGVTIPSQIRYVNYYSEYLTNGNKTKLPDNCLQLDRFEVSSIKGAEEISFKLLDRYGNELVTYGEAGHIKKDKNENKYIYKNELNLCLQDDIKFVVRSKNLPQKKKKDLFHFWLNIEFIDKYNVKLEKGEIDRALKDKSNKMFPSDFNVQIYFKDVDFSKERKKIYKSNDIEEEDCEFDEEDEEEEEEYEESPKECLNDSINEVDISLQKENEN
jgi:phosphatidylinositol-3,4,5-trisphosphate 3-phosphatase and dual-specificity protein phosphatase PTEN